MKIIPFVLLACFVVSCNSQVAVKKASVGETLVGRIDLYWQAKQKKDLDAIREFIDPPLREEYFRQLNSMGNRPNMSEITSYIIENVQEDGGSAVVTTKLAVKIVHALLGSPYIFEQRVRDRWVKKGDLWYIEIEKPNLADVIERFSKERKEVTGKEVGKEVR